MKILRSYDEKQANLNLYYPEFIINIQIASVLARGP